jgi:hypothetical protein
MLSPRPECASSRSALENGAAESAARRVLTTPLPAAPTVGEGGIAVYDISAQHAVERRLTLGQVVGARRGGTAHLEMDVAWIVHALAEAGMRFRSTAASASSPTPTCWGPTAPRTAASRSRITTGSCIPTKWSPIRRNNARQHKDRESPA